MRVLIYNGDWDACVPYTDNEAWTENMGYPATAPWHSWAYTSPAGNTNQVAGYAVNYGEMAGLPVLACYYVMILFDEQTSLIMCFAICKM